MNYKKIVAGAALALASVLPTISNASDTVTLHAKDTLIFRDVFTGDSVATAQAKAIELASHLAKDEPLYLYLDTPGGEITAGTQLIATLKGLPHEIKTITNFAASMGFITAESLGERLITENGILMSHRAKIGVQGQIPGEFNSESAFWGSLVTGIETSMAARMGMPLPAYQAMIKDEYWVSGAKAVEAHAADRVVKVRCGEDLSGTYDERINTIFGPLVVTWSQCPLISSPLSISFSNLDTLLVTDTLELDRLKRTVYDTLMSDKKLFGSDPVLQTNYYKYVK